MFKANLRLINYLYIFMVSGFVSLASSEYKPTIVEPITETWRWQNFPELSNRGCHCMVEGQNGYLWFGVNGGVIRYDGLAWEFFPLTQDSLDTPVVVLCAASDSTIYAGTSHTIYRYANEKWNVLPLDLEFGDSKDFPYNRFPIIETSDKSIWIGSRLGAIRIKNDNVSLFREGMSFRNLQDINKKNNYDKIRALPLFDIYCIYEDNIGKIWFGLRDGRIYNCKLPLININTNLFVHRVDTEPDYLKSKFPLIKMDADEKVFIVSGQIDKGINVYEKQKWKQIKVNKLFGTDDLQNDIILLKNGVTCIAGIGRVFLVKDNEWKMFERTILPFPSNRLRIFQTRNENLWIIGLSKDVWRIDLSDHRWTTYKDLIFQAESRDGDQWFITIDGKAVRYITNKNKWILYDQGDGLIDCPIAIEVTKNGEVWVVGSNNHVAATAHFDGKNWSKQIHPNISWGLDRRAIIESEDGSLWLGSTSDFDINKGQAGGLVRYKNSSFSDLSELEFEYYPCSDEFRLYGVYGIGQTSDQDIWAGQLGFYNLNHLTKKWKKITDPVGLSQNFVDCIQTDIVGDIWVGTRTNGLFHLNNKTNQWFQYTISNGLPSNSIIDILCVSNKNVWIATDLDISHFDGTDWTNDVFPGVFKYLRDGITIKSTKDGSIWINQNPPVWYRRALFKDRHFNRYAEEFKTLRYHPDNLPPETFITFSMDRVAQPGNVILSWNANDPWKSTPSNQIQYSYRFDDEEWSAFSDKKSEIFLSITSGYHIFEVRSRNRDQNIDPVPAKVRFYVEPPVWEEPWFIGLIMAFLTTISFFIFRLYHRNKIIQDLSETRARLFTNISHELRTPLTLIIGPLEKILSSLEMKSDFAKPLILMKKNSQRLLRLINQILDYRKIEARQMKFEPSKGDIIDFIHEEYLSFSNDAELKSINYSFITDSKKLNIWFDPDKIEKIIFNLLSNALKFTPPYKSVSIEIKTAVENKGKKIQLDCYKNMQINKWIEIIVRDTGIGISQPDLKKIFDRFYQVENHLSAAIGGTGIGLSVTKEMVKIHYGEIDVESKLGYGTSFYIKIPQLDQQLVEGIVNQEIIHKADYVKSNEEMIPDDECESQNKNTLGKILIVEDNDDMRQYIKIDLSECYEVKEAFDGVDGFEKAINFGPDLIISDIMMPRMDGIELCRKIKTDERTSHVVVILLTARSSQENLIVGLENGADDYLGKPFDSNELQLRVRNFIESRKKLQEKFNNSVKLETKSIAITSVDKKFMERAIDIINQHINDSDFNVDIFSHLMGMNRVSLYHKIKSLTSLSTREFFTVIRLKKAAQLLKESGLNVTEITYEVGFKDPSHFTKLFKKQFGKSPKDFMKEESTK